MITSNFGCYERISNEGGHRIFHQLNVTLFRSANFDVTNFALWHIICLDCSNISIFHMRTSTWAASCQKKPINHQAGHLLCLVLFQTIRNISMNGDKEIFSNLSPFKSYTQNGRPVLFLSNNSIELIHLIGIFKMLYLVRLYHLKVMIVMPNADAISGNSEKILSNQTDNIFNVVIKITSPLKFISGFCKLCYHHSHNSVSIIITCLQGHIGRKPASPAQGSRQRLHAGESHFRRWREHAG